MEYAFASRENIFGMVAKAFPGLRLGAGEGLDLLKIDIDSVDCEVVRGYVD